MEDALETNLDRLSRTLALTFTGVGVFITLFLSWGHYTGSIDQICQAGTDCGRVLSSAFSHFAGLPTSFYGFMYYFCFLILLMMLPYVTETGRQFILTLSLALHSVALLISVFLTFYSVMILQAVCQYCLISTVMVILLFGITVFWKIRDVKLNIVEEQSGQIWKGATIVMVILLIIAGGLYYRSTTTPGINDQSNELKALMAEGPSVGDPSAPIRVLEFYDLACPFCRKFTLSSFPEIREKYIETGKVVWKFMEFPNPSHRHSLYAHAFLSRVNDNQYVEAKKKIMTEANQWKASKTKTPQPYFYDLAGEYGLVQNWKPSPRLKNNLSKQRDFYNRELGVKSTPTFFINGKRYKGNLSYKQFRHIFQRILGDQASDVSGD